MNNFNFDEIVNRRGTHSVKYDNMKLWFGRDDLHAMWVADMDFKSPDCITETLKEYYGRGMYGYNIEPAELKPSIKNWLRDIQKWEVKEEWITFMPSVLKALGFAIQYFSKPGEKVIVQPPVYFSFMFLTENNDRSLVFNPLDNMKMDFDNFEKITDENDCKIFILCNPHNPGGVVWTKADLIRIAEICHRKGIIVISDEIHADLTLWGKQHIPFASVSEKAAEISITLGAPAKTFNIVGLCSAYSVIPNPRLREEFYAYLTYNHHNTPMIDASLATISAFNQGRDWRIELMKYIEGNIEVAKNFFEKEIPIIKMIHPEASFLLWLDCRDLRRLLAKKYNAEESQQLLLDFFIQQAHLAMNDGEMFGRNGEGSGYMRMNIGLPRKLLLEALESLKTAISRIK